MAVIKRNTSAVHLGRHQNKNSKKEMSKSKASKGGIGRHYKRDIKKTQKWRPQARHYKGVI